MSLSPRVGRTRVRIPMGTCWQPWALRGSQVELAHSRIHAKDCEDCASSEGRVDRIEVALKLEGSLSAEQSHRFLEISERCPVQRTLENEVSIRTTIV